MARRPPAAPAGPPSVPGEPATPPEARKRGAVRAPKKPKAPSAPSPAPPEPIGEPTGEIATALAALQDEVRGLRADLGARSPGQDAGAMARVLQDLAERLTTTSESLAGSLLEAPKAADFEPLAEHLYEFARNAPRLLEALQEIPKAATPIEASVRALHEISETLEFTREKLGESLLRLPRAEDYEPLARPLREFAKVSPALAESLAAVLGVVAPLGDSVHTLKEIAAELEASQAAVAQALTRQASPPQEDRGALDERTREILREVAETLRDVRQSIEDALASLPSDPAYGRLAAHLRELATVSPSLMEWLGEVPTLTRPLGESVDSLEEAAARLAAARERIVGLVD